MAGRIIKLRVNCTNAVHTKSDRAPTIACRLGFFLGKPRLKDCVGCKNRKQVEEGSPIIVTRTPETFLPTLSTHTMKELQQVVKSLSGHQKELLNSVITLFKKKAFPKSQLVTSLTKDEVASLDQLVGQAGQAKTEDDRVGLLSSTLTARGQIVCGGCRSAWVGYMRRNPFPVAVQDVQGWLVRLRAVLVKSESDFASKAIDPRTRSGM
jgi:hypothetical protein